MKDKKKSWFFSKRKSLLTDNWFSRTSELQNFISSCLTVYRWNHFFYLPFPPQRLFLSNREKSTAPAWGRFHFWLLLFFFLSMSINPFLCHSTLRCLVVINLLSCWSRREKYSESVSSDESVSKKKKLWHHDLPRWLMCRFTLTFILGVFTYCDILWNMSPVVEHKSWELYKINWRKKKRISI